MTDQTTPQQDDQADLAAQPDPAADGTDARPDMTETFDREYVQKLREEAASHRVRAKRADALAAALVTATAALTGRLADPADLPYSDDLLDDHGLVDQAKVRTAVEDLIRQKPHFAARRPAPGNLGQGARPESVDVRLSGLLRRGT